MTKKKEAFNVGVDADVMWECDCCGGMFPKSFFCKKCSNKYIGTEWEETPKRNWPDGTQDEMEMTKVDQFSGDICGNCCTCHLR